MRTAIKRCRVQVTKETNNKNHKLPTNMYLFATQNLSFVESYGSRQSKKKLLHHAGYILVYDKSFITIFINFILNQRNTYLMTLLINNIINYHIQYFITTLKESLLSLTVTQKSYVILCYVILNITVAWYSLTGDANILW